MRQADEQCDDDDDQNDTVHQQQDLMNKIEEGFNSVLRYRIR